MTMFAGRSLAPLVIPTGGMFGGSPATTPGSVALSTFTYLPDTPATPTTPLTPMQPNVAYQLPRHSSIPFDVMDEMNEDLRLIINECRIESSRLSLQTSIGKGEHCDGRHTDTQTDKHTHTPHTRTGTDQHRQR